MIVADATVFIALVKIGQLELLRLLYEKALMSSAVEQEVVHAGSEIGALDVRFIESALASGWIEVVSLETAEKELADEIQSISSLHRGEAESIAVASMRSLLLVLDEREARIIARTMSVEHIGTVALTLHAYINEILDYNELAKAVGDLAEVMWLSPAIVSEVLLRAREVGK